MTSSAATAATKPKRRRIRDRSPHDYAQMVTRMIKAYGRRVQDADQEDLADMVAMRAVLDETITATIQHMHEHQEFSWSSIGAVLGCSKQAAQQRYGRKG